MLVKDAKNNTVCDLNEATGEVAIKYKGFTLNFVLKIGQSIKLTRNGVYTSIYRTSSTYKIDTYCLPG